MPYVRPGAASTGNTALPANLQLKKREEENNEDNTPKDYTGAVGKNGSILTRGLLPKTPKTAQLGERRVAFHIEPTEDNFSSSSSVEGNASDREDDTPDGLDSFELSPKETDADKTKTAASGSQEKTRAIETALALLDTSQSETLANRPGLSAHRQKQLAKKAEADTVQAEKAE